MNDTPEHVRKLYRRMLLEKSGAERVMMGSRMFDAARSMVLASLPEGLSEREIRIALLERFYGNDFTAEELSRICEAL